MATSPDCVREGDSVVFDVSSGSKSVMVVKKKSKLKMGSFFCSLENVIGAPYGTAFGLASDGRSLQPIQPDPPADWIPPPAEGEQRNNSRLLDGGHAHQQLSAEAVEALKAGGARGADLVAAVAAGSVTFEGKTEFSKAKYLKKKARKYAATAVVQRADALALCQAYAARQPWRTGHLREDALALLLSLGDLRAGADALVLDGCGGLLAAAAAERLAGCGRVVVLRAADRVSQGAQEVLRSCALSVQERASVRWMGADEIGAALGRGSGKAVASASDASDAPPSAPEAEDVDATTAPADSDAPPSPSAPLVFTSCLVSVPSVAPLASLAAALPLLAPGAAFAVHCQWLAPLAEAMQALMRGPRAVGLSLQEPWLRDMQVLPGRTHPLMRMDHSGGYLLSGYAVAL